MSTDLKHKALQLLSELELYFISSNAVPVDKAHISNAEFRAMQDAVHAALAAAPAGGAEPVATAIVQRATGSTWHTRLVTHAGWRDLPDGETKLYAAPTLLNGLTEQETAASASVAGLSGAQPERLPYVSAIDPTLLAIHARTVERAERLGLDDAQPEAPAEPSDEYLPQTWVAAVANECGVGVERMSCLFDFAERVQRATRLATPAPVAQQPAELNDIIAERDALLAKLNTPELHDFAAGVVQEAAHQRERWGTEHDAGKEPADWFWLLGYLGGKVLNALKTGDTDKALHHTVSSAAALANWHAAISGANTSMRPGIDPAAIKAQGDQPC